MPAPIHRSDSDQIIPINIDDETVSRGEDIDTLARTIWGESRGESTQGKQAVACVIINRWRQSQIWNLRGKKSWWGNTIEEICRKPYQFSCWNPGDVNRAKISCLDKSDPGFQTCKRIARRALSGILPDNVHGATHYHHHQITPKWALGQCPCQAIGNHLFYRDI